MGRAGPYRYLLRGRAGWKGAHHWSLWDPELEQFPIRFCKRKPSVYVTRLFLLPVVLIQLLTRVSYRCLRLVTLNNITKTSRHQMAKICEPQEHEMFWAAYLTCAPSVGMLDSSWEVKGGCWLFYFVLKWVSFVFQLDSSVTSSVCLQYQADGFEDCIGHGQRHQRPRHDWANAPRLWLVLRTQSIAPP